MKTLITTLQKYFPIIALVLSALLLSSCATQNQKYDNTDGVYGSEAKISSAEPDQEVDKTNYYKQYFKSKAGAYEELPEEGAIFTDIEAYSTTDSLDEDGYIVIEEQRQEESYGAWGSNSENVTVNIYNGAGYGGYGGYGYGGYGYGGWGFSYGWGYPNLWGFNYGWGSPFYGGFYCPPYYGGYYNPYHYNGYGYGNNIAYNRGRRNTSYVAGRSNSRNRSNNSYRGNYRGRNAYARSAKGTSRRSQTSRYRVKSSRPDSRTRSAANGKVKTRPSTKPKARPASRPSSRPASRPSSRPSSRPASRPSSRPASSNRGGRSSGRGGSSGRRGRG